MNPYEILDKLTMQTPQIEFNGFALLKLPALMFLFIIMFFSLLLFLRVRILSDTFTSPDNRMIKTIVVLHLLLTIAGTLISLLLLSIH